MRKDVAFARERYRVSERRACKLLGMDRGSYRYEPRPDRNAELREALVALARQKPRFGYRRRPIWCAATRSGLWILRATRWGTVAGFASWRWWTPSPEKTFP